MNQKDKIVIVGDGCYYIYELALFKAFVDKGYENCTLFTYKDYLNVLTTEKNLQQKLSKISIKIQNKLSFGWKINKINRDLKKYCQIEKPKLIFLYRARHIYASTVNEIKKMGCVVFSYNNDNPFSSYYPKYFWRHYKKSLRYCDLAFVYRESNKDDCINAGCNHVEILRSYYLKERNYPLDKERINISVPRVVFLGHYEEDSRKEYLEALAQSGIEVGVPETWLGKINPHNIVFLKETADKYNEMLNATHIAIVFLSSLNQDTYTRRCFEIPATKTLMLSVYTEELDTMFRENIEAVYFRNKEELVEKVNYYLEHNVERKQIGEAGYQRLLQQKDEVGDRVEQIMKKYDELKRNYRK